MSQTELYFLLFPLGGWLLLAASLLFLGLWFRGKRKLASPLGKLQVFTLFAFGSVLLFFFPYFFFALPSLFGGAVVPPILALLYETIRTFLLYGNYATVLADLAPLGLRHSVHVFYVVNIGVAMTVAPLLTFGNVLTLVGNFFGQLRFSCLSWRTAYVFSVLNDMSLAMAQDIYEQKPRAFIVFCDVSSHNLDVTDEQKARAKAMHAVLLKQNVLLVNVKRRRARVEFLLLSEDEGTNLAHAIRLCQDHCANPNRAVYLFSSHTEAGYVLDSLDKGPVTVSPALKRQVEQDPKGFLLHPTLNAEDLDKQFFLRRINLGAQMALDVLADTRSPALFEQAVSDADKTISLLILGAGGYGKIFFKTALWLYQLFDYRLEINLFDLAGEGLLSRLTEEMPEIFDDARGAVTHTTVEGAHLFERNDAGDCRYSVCVFPSVDCFGREFEQLFASSSISQRLARTKAAIVTLGNDETNIRAALSLRSMFDRCLLAQNKPVQDKQGVKPAIYAVVYDDQKASNLQYSKSGIHNHKGQCYDVQFIGSFHKQFAYRVVEQYKQWETKGLRYHLDWARLNYLRSDRPLDCFGQEGTYREQPPTPAEDDQLKEKALEALAQYVNYEYARESSIARARQQEFLRHYLPALAYDDGKIHWLNCACPQCRKAAVTEHARWNAFMRVNGFRYGKATHFRAKLHRDLVTWSLLDNTERNKDHALGAQAPDCATIRDMAQFDGDVPHQNDTK